jgi:hypothetical protein
MGIPNVLGVLTCLVAIATAVGAKTPQFLKREPQSARYGYVSANATVVVDGRRVRVKAVSKVFEYCESRDRRSAILEDSDSAFVATFRARFADGFSGTRNISFRRVGEHRTAEQAEEARRHELSDPGFGDHVIVEYAWRVNQQCR